MDPFLAAQLSMLAYEKPTVAIPDAARIGLTGKFYQSGGNQGYIFSDDDRAICAFRGTQLLEHVPRDKKVSPPRRLRLMFNDILIDLRAFKTSMGAPFGRVHRGFLSAFESVWYRGRMSHDLALAHSNKQLFFTGHSLGAAMATLATAHCTTRRSVYKNIVGLVTFGSPRVGSKKFTRDFEESFSGHLRFVNSCDVVPRVPCRLWGYHHCDLLQYFDDSGLLCSEPLGYGRWFCLKDRLRAYWRDFGEPGLASRKKHSLTQYYRLTERNHKKCTVKDA